MTKGLELDEWMDEKLRRSHGSVINQASNLV